MPSGHRILELARRHVGEKYILGALAPKNNSNWKGPWDCAEFASWNVFQTAQILYGCDKNNGNPATADAWTGFWKRDADSLGKKISVDEAARTPGAMVLRVAPPGSVGHIVISDGKGGTVEAHSSKRGVIESTLTNRRWDIGVLVPGITYKQNAVPVIVAPPSSTVFRLKKPPMTGPEVRAIQQKLKALNFNPGPIDGQFGPMTHAAVISFQVSRGLLADGEVGPRTLRALGL